MIIQRSNGKIESIVLQPSTLHCYFVIAKDKMELLMPNYSQRYEEARKASIKIGGIVTNASCIRNAGLDIKVWERKPREPKKRNKIVNYNPIRKPIQIELLTIDGKELTKGF